jgi:hypothetical protein
MDVLGNERYFSRRVLLLARESDLVKFTACAASAKQLGQVRHLEKRSRSKKHQVSMWRALESNRRDYLWCGAKYYGKAIKSMAAEIARTPLTSVDSPNSEILYMITSPSSVSTASAEQILSETNLAAACIMCQYERLSASHRAVDRHLNGIYKLLRLDHVDTTFNYSTAVNPFSPTTPPRNLSRSMFWFFVQNDFEESCKPAYIQRLPDS